MSKRGQEATISLSLHMQIELCQSYQQYEYMYTMTTNDLLQCEIFWIVKSDDLDYYEISRLWVRI